MQTNSETLKPVVDVTYRKTGCVPRFTKMLISKKYTLPALTHPEMSCSLLDSATMRWTTSRVPGEGFVMGSRDIYPHRAPVDPFIGLFAHAQIPPIFLMALLVQRTVVNMFAFCL